MNERRSHVRRAIASFQSTDVKCFKYWQQNKTNKESERANSLKYREREHFSVYPRKLTDINF